MTQSDFPHLFSPLSLRHKTLKNRLVFGAHTANMSAEGLPGERHRGYYEERARGGAAMIVVEPMPVHPTAVLTRGNFRHSDDAVIPAFRRITEACKAHDVVILEQLYHVGQHGDFDNSFRPNGPRAGSTRASRTGRSGHDRRQRARSRRSRPPCSARPLGRRPR